ncbi:MAG TPA: hypothetical protein H9698_01155 [Candidatus Ruthenibacterium merdavium]|uniref:Uncharacterized protein n=1 Tax=Candidatus Ruthenibacterium merdavium TaxID=2838752 RepID=A0A9D2Q1U6_9FIRM|nr:hypothetical protein [Candidatus Ruthenibacterium merdavium]
MVDVAKYPEQGTLSFSRCGELTLDELINRFMQVCLGCCTEQGLNVTVRRDEFKTSNAARKMGGVISLVGKMVQKSCPGFTIESKSENYRIHLVGGQYMDEISFDLFFFTGFALERNARKRDYAEHRFQEAIDCVKKAYESMTN